MKAIRNVDPHSIFAGRLTASVLTILPPSPLMELQQVAIFVASFHLRCASRSVTRSCSVSLEW